MAAGKTVVVTGATGFIASNLVRDLLERGYIVRGTVRNPDDLSKVGFLVDMPGAKDRLTLYKANLLQEGDFDSVVEGADGVFHTASPFSYKISTDPQTQFIDPAVKGTVNLLEAAAKAKSVRRVVLTSSTASLLYNNNPRAGAIVDETWWTDPGWCREQEQWYPLSKTLAEKAAWDFVAGKHFDLVVINPVLVIGKVLQPTLNTSTETIGEYLSGSVTKYKNVAMGFVDVQDVSLGHILAFENPDAVGRYILAEGVYHHREIAQRLRKLFPEYPVPTEPGYDPAEEVPTYTLSNEKAQKLGIKFRPIDSQLKDLVASLEQRGWLNSSRSVAVA